MFCHQIKSGGNIVLAVEIGPDQKTQKQRIFLNARKQNLSAAGL
jgi:hypothetical protein